jgi:putative flippase GtrA
VVRTPADLIALARSPGGQKLLKYSAVSAISVVIGETCLVIFQLVVGLSPGWANLAAAAVATFPSYELNRSWAWGKSGKSHLWKEVVPFWVLAFVGLAFSEVTAIAAGNYADHRHWTHNGRGLLVAAVVLATYGVLWIGKFVIINKLLFVHPDGGTVVADVEVR